MLDSYCNVVQSLCNHGHVEKPWLTHSSAFFVFLDGYENRHTDLVTVLQGGVAICVIEVEVEDCFFRIMDTCTGWLLSWHLREGITGYQWGRTRCSINLAGPWQRDSRRQGRCSKCSTNGRSGSGVEKLSVEKRWSRGGDTTPVWTISDLYILYRLFLKLEYLEILFICNYLERICNDLSLDYLW